MYSFGFISLNPELENSYFTEVAKRGSDYDIECYRFSPIQINPVTHLVTGEKYHPDLQEWQPQKFQLPDILYDRCFYSEHHLAKNAIAIMKWLKNREDLLFIGHGLPNKWKLYQTLSNSNLSPYVVKTISVIDAFQTLSFLEREKKIILKPTSGSGGMGIACLEKEKETISVIVEKQQQILRSTFPSISIAQKWIDNIRTQKEYLAQPFLQLVDQDNRPFDIRILIQKDGNGQWVERGRGIRTGQTNGVLSNLSAGAETVPFHKWLNSLDPKKIEFLEKEINEITTQLPIILEETYPPLFEIGIDIGVAQDLSLWILDVNSKPGRKVVLETTPFAQETLYTAPLEYGRMLAGQYEQGRKSYEKTFSNRNQ
jgi:glutathione synthase/RimK-type ligase-like ATP-grasp enzyme